MEELKEVEFKNLHKKLYRGLSKEHYEYVLNPFKKEQPKTEYSKRKLLLII